MHHPPQRHATTFHVTELLAEDAQQREVLLPAWVVDEEFELVKQALWTEPEDQAGWLYHRWLLGSALAAREAAEGAWHGAWNAGRRGM